MGSKISLIGVVQIYGAISNLQIEELINELQSAFDAEQLPYEQKKKRKDIMKDIDNRNKSIQIEINTVKKNLPVLLAGGIL